MTIFNGISENELNSLLKCLNAVKKTYLKDEIIIDTGDKITAAGYVLEGSVQTIKDDYEGNKIIISDVKKGETFALAFVCAGIEKSGICAKAVENTQVLFLDFERILSVCTHACPFHKKLIENIIRVLAVKNLFLQERIELLSKKTLRERILHFLNKDKPAKNKIFEIPYSREQMAEFIGADRSALSRELASMKKNNIIDYHKNSFKLM